MTVPADIAKVVDVVRSGASRTFTCRGCGAEAQVLALPGLATKRLPARCETCSPDNAIWRRERSERPLRAAIIALSDQVALLEQLSREEASIAGRARRFGDPGRDAVRRAVVRVAHAKGVAATADALLDLSAVARAWALALTRTPRPVSLDDEPAQHAEAAA